MKDISGQRLLRSAVWILDRIRQHYFEGIAVRLRRWPCAILARDVNPFVCCPRLDGDRRFEVRFSRKIPLPV
jgi:hypothetical protein